MQIFDILSWTIPYTKITLANIMWALLTLIVGYVIIIVFLDAFKRSLSRAGIPPLAAGIITRLTSILLYVALLLAVVSALGFNTSSIILGLSAVIGLILGFGLQDTINNLAAGVWITIVRAFKKGDFVSVAGYTGTIEDVGILSTKMKLPSGEIALIPNRNVWGQPIVNYSAADKRRFEFTVGVAYG
ncbi:MAG: mechanosensitive ion channel, partial [Crenarchaeota archaeon]|nr:mechanosensitive ion channel [Thermoproteota archaeon]